MKKSNIFTLLQIMLSCILFVGCNQNEGEIVIPTTVSPQTIEVSYRDTIVSINITSTAKWNLSGASTWCTPLITYGEGNDSIIIEIDKNLSEESRVDSFNLTTSLFESFTIVIQQKSASHYSSVQPDYVKVSNNSSTIGVFINCLEGWNLTNVFEWVTPSKRSGFGSDSVYFTISDNLEYNSRIDTIIVLTDFNESFPIIVDQIPNPDTLRTLNNVLKSNSEVSIFYAALELTGLNDSLRIYEDKSYLSPSEDSCYVGVYIPINGSVYKAKFKDKRPVKFTVFVETNNILNNNNIYDINDLIEYCKNIYDESYPEDKGLYDNNFTDRRNPLNRFIAYHILPEGIKYSLLNCREDIIESRNVGYDFEDFYETMMPHSILRISTTCKKYEKYINRKGDELTGVIYSGIKITKPANNIDSNANNDCINGYYHYIDNILTYSKNTREDVLKCRIRVDLATTSPDFFNSDARGETAPYTAIGFKGDCVRNWQCKNLDNRTNSIYVRSQFSCNWSYEGDGVTAIGNSDVVFKIPAVPISDTYEIRLSVKSTGDGGIYQPYFGTINNMEKCGEPINFQISAADPSIGWKEDLTETNSGLSAIAIEEYNNAIDKSMRQNGYMKGIDSQTNGSDVFRSLATISRRIITQEYLLSEQDYYLRLQSVINNHIQSLDLDYIEIVPQCIYDGPVPEDRH